MEIRTFEELYIAELQEARSFEQMLVEALPKMAEAAEDEELVEAFQRHLDETRFHLQQVQGILEMRKAGAADHRDSSMEKLIQEAEKMLRMVPEGPLRDAAIIASAQRIEHYEIAVYGTLATYAELLDLEEDKEALGAILDEEKDADETLSDIAAGIVNPEAVEEEAREERPTA